MPVQALSTSPRLAVTKSDDDEQTPVEKPAIQLTAAQSVLQARFVDRVERTSLGQRLLEKPWINHVKILGKMDEPVQFETRKGASSGGVINVKDIDSIGSRQRQTAVLTHEALHAHHHHTNPDAYKRRMDSNGTHAGWTNAEEELTITGLDPTAPGEPYDPLNENAVRQELDLRERYSSRNSCDDLQHLMDYEEYLVHQKEAARQEPLISDKASFAESIARFKTSLTLRSSAPRPQRGRGSSRSD